MDIVDEDPADQEPEPGHTVVGSRSRPLGRLVAARRGELGLSVRAAAQRGGLDGRTWARVEEGGRVQPSRLAAIDAALGWTPGASHLYLRGRIKDPTYHRPPVPADMSDPDVLVALGRAAAEVQRYTDELLRRQARRR